MTKRTAAIALGKGKQPAPKVRSAIDSYETYIDQYETPLSDLFDQFHALLTASGLPIPNPKEHAPREFAMMVYDNYVSRFSVVDDEDGDECSDVDSDGNPITAEECEESSTAQSTSDAESSEEFDSDVLESDDPDEFNDDSEDDPDDGDVDEDEAEGFDFDDEEDEDDEEARESKE
jgi:hypothetical protein